ncbi:MAG: hypothetical protein J0H21_03320, partial [Rhizobiales bacterium]|nr:hypothetical protein [Hyphomicrobiales bacterium]
VTGHDFRGYSASIKYALISGLMAAGCAEQRIRDRPRWAATMRGRQDDDQRRNGQRRAERMDAIAPRVAADP